MSDTTATPTTPEAPKGTSDENGNPTPATPAQDPTDWKAEARKWEQRAKDNTDAAKRLAEIEEASKSEAEKQAEALASAQRELEQFKQRDQVRSWAREIVTDSNVPADALRGSTREELEEHFGQLKALITPAAQTSDPVPGIDGTPSGSGNVTISEQIKAAEAAGNKELVAALKALQLSS